MGSVRVVLHTPAVQVRTPSALPKHRPSTIAKSARGLASMHTDGLASSAWLVSQSECLGIHDAHVHRTPMARIMARFRQILDSILQP
jgi:hypothetical protein